MDPLIYIEGVISETKRKAITLKGKFDPNNVDSKLYQLSQLVLRELDVLILHLDSLLIGSEYQVDNAQKGRLQSLREIIRILDKYENTVLVSLSRPHKDDVFITNIIEKICREIKFPLAHPVATCITRSYYEIYSELNLLCLPLLETDFLLHLPDLYHELCHLLLDLKNNPRIEPFQIKKVEFNGQVRKHFEKEIKNKNLRGEQKFTKYLELWKTCWLNPRSKQTSWSIEFFCDLFALYTVGPSYAWAHLHLMLKNGGNPYSVPIISTTTHPCDFARFLVLIEGLKLLDCQEEINSLKEHWRTFTLIEGNTENQYIQYAYPKNLLVNCAKLSMEAVKSIGCKVYNCEYAEDENEFAEILNEAWHQFLIKPFEYKIWEKNKIKELKASFS